MSHPRKGRSVWVFLCLLLFTMLLVNMGAAEGTIFRQIPPGSIIRVVANRLPLVGHRFPLPDSFKPEWAEIVWSIRLPRAIAGLLIGMILGMAGVAFQSLLMNPLADPYTTGVASGSALGSVLLTTFAASVASQMGGLVTTATAFVSGLVAVGIVYMLARVDGRISAQTFLLAGTIVGSFFFALLPLLLSWTTRNDPQQRTALFATLFGSLTLVDWPKCLLLLVFASLGLLWLQSTARELDIMAQGEETAAHLGLDTERFKRHVIVGGALLTAVTVSIAGIIAFVGFLVPHIARRLVGTSHRGLVLASAILGGLIVMLADCLSRVLFNDIEIGVITSLLGVPFFCILIRQQMNR